MSFNPGPSKQAREAIFSKKVNKDSQHALLSRHRLTFNNNIVYPVTSQRHLGIILDNRLSSQEHRRLVFSKINRTIGLLRKLRCLIPRSSLLTINKTFVQPHLDYGDTIYEKAYNSSFYQKIESVQYNTCLAITGVIRGISREKLYNQLGIESSTPSLVQRVVLLLQISQKWISSVSFQISSFKTIPLYHQKY